MKFNRASGILLHPTSLPSPFGIGDIGPSARSWIDFLNSTGTGLWQVLPLGPTGYGDSPYQCFSAFAGNPLLISPYDLLEIGLIHANDIVEVQSFPNDHVEYGDVIAFKNKLLDRAYEEFKRVTPVTLKEQFQQFITDEKFWLEDYALFMAIKEHYNGRPWINWEESLRTRDPESLNEFRIKHKYQVEKHMFRQFMFFYQWSKLKEFANQSGIKIIGDIPIFVAHDSADVWAHPELFYLDNIGNPTVVAGVPPDYFSPTGQLWGNPLYRWEVHAQDDYQWWKKRFQSVFKLVDFVRLDHFRGFAGYWEIPAKETTAIKGKWRNGPGAHFFNSLKQSMGDLPIIAEDLGEITPDVIALRDQFGFPGMRILVFAFSGDSSNPFLPHNYIPNTVVYTGTHDNDTVVGWYHRVEEPERDFARRYLASDGNDIAWDLIRAAWASVAVFAIAPMQDILSLDNRARMNYPSRLGGNWTWRMLPDAINPSVQQRLLEFNKLYARTKPD